MDYREELFQSVVRSMIEKGYEPDVIEDISNILISKIGNYEIAERCTELMVVENHSEKLVSYFIGTILTEGKSKATATNYMKLIQRFYHDINKPLVEANVFDFRRWFAAQMNIVSARTVDTYRAYLSSFYQFLAREEIIEKNPMAKIKPIKYNEKIKKSFGDVELERMRNVCNIRDRAILELLLSSGMRVSELCALDQEDVDWSNYQITIRHGKGDKSRTVFFDKKSGYYLKQYLNSKKVQTSELFVNRNHNRLKRANVERELKKIGSLANVSDVHPHRCRVHFATDKYRKGMDLRTIQKILGHASIETTMGYIANLIDKTKMEYQRFA